MVAKTLHGSYTEVEGTDAVRRSRWREQDFFDGERWTGQSCDRMAGESLE